ncbi:double-CXXCG motif protein [Archangium sp.]|uniref:SitI6 family double-CXXCG motif immunity protein n=1 Tax=Archangium sp. TaxID=1872627 RepID=UPI00286A37F1|nr:double-CXXCG motif protein [Archangium sp.]
MRYFIIEEDKSLGYTGFVNAAPKWGLPGVKDCPACKATWADISKAYPSVDLTPVAALARFERPGAKPIEEYERMRELVRPLLPPGAVVEPGSCFGPLVGNAQGRFGQFVSYYSQVLLVRHEALEKLQAEGLRGLKGCRMEVRFRQRHSPELLELELLPVGRLHSKCLPPNREPPCPRCDREGLTLPKQPVLDAATLPPHLDLFRLLDMSTLVICTERFAQACQRLGLDGIVFVPIPTEG